MANTPKIALGWGEWDFSTCFTKRLGAATEAQYLLMKYVFEDL